MASARAAANFHPRGLRARIAEIDESVLRELFKEALAELADVLYPTDPASDLPEEEVAALREGGVVLEGDETARRETGALARTMATYAALIETSPRAAEAAGKLGVDPSRVRQMLASGRLYGFQVKGEWRIPLFQFDGDRLLPGMEEVAAALRPGFHPVSVYRWFTSPSPDLAPPDLDRDLSPREWLQAGYPPRAVADIATHLDIL